MVNTLLIRLDKKENEPYTMAIVPTNQINEPGTMRILKMAREGIKQ